MALLIREGNTARRRRLIAPHHTAHSLPHHTGGEAAGEGRGVRATQDERKTRNEGEHKIIIIQNEFTPAQEYGGEAKRLEVILMFKTFGLIVVSRILSLFPNQKRNTSVKAIHTPSTNN